MNKSILLTCFGIFSNILFAQVGVQTANPLGNFHVDGKKDNPKTGNTVSLVQEQNDFIITKDAKVGTRNISPNQMLDVNGKTQVRDLSNLSSSSTNILYADDNGDLGFYTPTPHFAEAAYYMLKNLHTYSTSDLADYNLGNKIIVPIQSNEAVVNSLATTVLNNNIKINDAGYYFVGGAVNFFISSKTAEAKIHVASNIEVSSDNGTTWRAISGSKTLFVLYWNGLMNNSLLVPSVLTKLNKNEIIRVVFYRTKDSTNLVQGDPLSSLGITNGYGSPSYSISISKL